SHVGSLFSPVWRTVPIFLVARSRSRIESNSGRVVVRAGTFIRDIVGRNTGGGVSLERSAIQSLISRLNRNDTCKGDRASQSGSRSAESRRGTRETRCDRPINRVRGSGKDASELCSRPGSHSSGPAADGANRLGRQRSILKIALVNGLKRAS